tara:strand:+ start:4567 stop:5178 length:612 start_codon:yes stop_codon:yes gene_type:complete
MSNKFNESYKHAMKRFSLTTEGSNVLIPHNRERTGGLTPGDRIKFVENILSSKWFKSQPGNVQEMVKELHTGDLNLFVDGIDSTVGPTDAGRGIHAIIARELAPGFQCPDTKITLPAELCEMLASTGDRATAPIPDSWRGPERVTIKPEPVNMSTEEVADSPEEQTLKADDGTGKLVDSDHKLPEKNIPGKKGGSYTQSYMPS